MHCEETARSHAREINDIWHGLRYYCPDCGRQAVLDPDAYGEEEHPCPFCDADGKYCEMEEYDLYAWLGDQLEISEFRHTDRHGPVSSAVILMGCGGPDVRLDTKTHQVIVTWGFDQATAEVDEGACEDLDRRAQDCWDAM